MKKEGHPEVFNVVARCVCGTQFETISTSEKIDVEICSQCHPYFTGAQKFVDTAGRIERFNERFTKKQK
jgi:large subunit ribosomal protein L31